MAPPQIMKPPYSAGWQYGDTPSQTWLHVSGGEHAVPRASIVTAHHEVPSHWTCSHGPLDAQLTGVPTQAPLPEQVSP
jgi:hypothetical protein